MKSKRQAASLIRLFILGLIILVPTACAQPPSPTAVSLASPTPESSYPIATQPSVDSGYPVNSIALTEEAPPPLITANPSLGRLKGVLLLRGNPVINYGLYLGELIKNEAGQEAVIALDMAIAPSGYTGKDGSFEIVNIPPGRYGLILITVKDSFHLYYPDRQESLIITVVDNQLVDLGQLNYDMLPIIQP